MSAGKPEPRTATVEVKYWWCGSARCSRHHPTEAAACKCPKRKPPRMFGNDGASLDRNRAIWNLVIEKRAALSVVGKRYGLSGSRVAGIVHNMARRRGWPWGSVPELRNMASDPALVDAAIMRELARYPLQHARTEDALNRRHWPADSLRRALDQRAFRGIPTEPEEKPA